MGGKITLKTNFSISDQYSLTNITYIKSFQCMYNINFFSIFLKFQIYIIIFVSNQVSSSKFLVICPYPSYFPKSIYCSDFCTNFIYIWSDSPEKWMKFHVVYKETYCGV